MSALPTTNYIGFESLNDIKKLPLAVVIQRGKEVKVYRVEGEESRNYFNYFSDPFLRFGPVEEITKKLGKEISKESFLNAKVFPAQMGTDGQGNEYIIYRARFKEDNS